MSRGNPNPSPLTRFQAGHGPSRGRKKGARDRITTKFLEELADAFELNGRAAIDTVMVFDTTKFLQIVAALVPQEVTLAKPLHGLDDATVAEIVEKLRAVLMPSSADEGGQPGAVH